MNYLEFKGILSDVKEKATSIESSYQVFLNENGKSNKNEILVYKNEYTGREGTKFHYIFVEIEGRMYFKRTEPSKINWKKAEETHTNPSERFVLDLGNTVEKFLESSIPTTVVSEIKLPKSKKAKESVIEKEEVIVKPVKTIDYQPAILPIRPDHYGGDSNPHEPRKIIRHYQLTPNIANVIKYVLRAGKKKGNSMQDEYKKAITSLRFEIEDLDEKQ